MQTCQPVKFVNLLAREEIPRFNMYHSFLSLIQELHGEADPCRADPGSPDLGIRWCPNLRKNSEVQVGLGTVSQSLGSIRGNFQPSILRRVPQAEATAEDS